MKVRLSEAGEPLSRKEKSLMSKILLYLWMIFSIIVIGKAYYDTAKDVFAWIKKKINKKEEKEDVDSIV
jgi:cell division protein FtsL